MTRLCFRMMMVVAYCGFAAAGEPKPKENEAKEEEKEAERALWVAVSHMRTLEPNYTEALGRVDRLRGRLWQLDRDRPKDEKPEEGKKADEALQAVAREVAQAKKKLLETQAGFVERKLPRAWILPEDTGRPKPLYTFEIAPKTADESVERELRRIQGNLQRIDVGYKDTLKKRARLEKEKEELEKALKDAEDPKNKEKIMEGVKERGANIESAAKEIKEREMRFVRSLIERLYNAGDVLKTDELVQKYLKSK